MITGGETGMLSIHYSISAGRVLRETGMKEMLNDMQEAGVGTVWLYGYFFGRFESSIDEMKQAKLLLEEQYGFAVNVINLPVGHPGNALDPVFGSDEDLLLPGTWKYRINDKGETVYYCACINEVMVNDNVEAAQLLRDNGFNTVFYDDDLRLGNHGGNVQGCFCEDCIAEFNSRESLGVTREELQKCTENPKVDIDLCESWTSYNCEKIVRFLKKVTLPGMRSGIMVMHDGDRRHGIDIPLIKRELPDCLFRVGESHFSDKSFDNPEGQASLMASIENHKRLVGDIKNCFSETTVFPAFALSPENWIKKMEIEIQYGLTNLFLMSGTWMLTKEYWAALKQELPRLRRMAGKA